MKKSIILSAVILPFLFLIACKSTYQPLSVSLIQENVSWKSIVNVPKTTKGLEVKLNKKVVLETTETIKKGKVYQGKILLEDATIKNPVTLPKGMWGVIIDVDSVAQQALVSFGAKGESLLFGASSDSTGVFLLANSTQKNDDGAFEVDYKDQLQEVKQGQDVEILVKVEDIPKTGTSSSPPGRRINKN